MSILQQIQRELDREPTPGEVMARVIRLECVVEKLASRKLNDIFAAPRAESQPQQQSQQPQQQGS